MVTQCFKRRRKGAALIMLCLLLGLIFIAIAFSVDVARVQLTQLELQAAADAAARAGAEAMARGVGDGTSTRSADAAIRAEIAMVAGLNRAGGSAVSLDHAAEIEFGDGIQTGGSSFLAAGNGTLANGSNAVRVKTSIDNYPIVFGPFVGGTTVSPNQSGAAMVQERDIVLVLDKSSSMLTLDAGSYSITDYNANLAQLQEDLFLSDDAYHPSGPLSTSSLHTEFVASSGTYQLSRMQALKLAVLRFRQEVDRSRGNEQLGLVAYAGFANEPSNAPTAPGTVDIAAGLPAFVYDAIVGDGSTKSDTASPYGQDIDERNAAALEDESNGYDNFDFNYLSMRWAQRTNIADGIEKGVNVLYGPGRRASATPILVVMTDGVHNTSGSPQTSASAAMVAHPNLRICTVTFGTGADQSTMHSIANTGNGYHYHANDVDELITIFTDLATKAGVTLIE